MVWVIHIVSPSTYDESRINKMTEGLVEQIISVIFSQHNRRPCARALHPFRDQSRRLDFRLSGTFQHHPEHEPPFSLRAQQALLPMIPPDGTRTHQRPPGSEQPGQSNHHLRRDSMTERNGSSLDGRGSVFPAILTSTVQDPSCFKLGND